MRILSISYLDIWPSGEGKGIPTIFIMQKALIDRGHEVHFICPVRQGSAGYSSFQGINLYRIRLPFNITAALSAKPIRLDKFPSHLKATILFNLAWIFFQFSILFWAIKIAKKVKPQVVYSHDCTPAFPAYLVSRLFSSKFILRIYGTRNLFWSYKNIFLRLKEFRDYAALKLPADYLIITKDGTNADLLVKELGVKGEKIKHWRNGVDFGFYDPDPAIKMSIREKLGIKPDHKIIISTSRVIPFYNPERLVYSLPGLFKLNPKCACIIASDGPDKEKLREYVCRNNIEDKVFFTGMVERGYLKDLLNASDLFVSFSAYSNCNNALFEAMVTGKCVITLDNDITRELIISGENGYLVKESELVKLPEILDRILKDENVLRKVSENIRNTALNKLWTWEKRMDEESKLLEALV